MYQVHCLNSISPKGTDLLTEDYQRTETIAEAEAILVRSAAMHDMALPESLLAIARAGAGVNNIPLEKCAEQGIVVFNTPGANANAVKELAIAALLLASRKIVDGINWAAIIAWVAAFILPLLTYFGAAGAFFTFINSINYIFSFVIGFVVYVVLMKTSMAGNSYVSEEEHEAFTERA